MSNIKEHFKEAAELLVPTCLALSLTIGSGYVASKLIKNHPYTAPILPAATFLLTGMGVVAFNSRDIK